MVEKQPGIQVVAEIDPEFQSALANHMPLGNAGALFVLLGALLRFAHPGMH